MYAFDALLEGWVKQRLIPGAVLDIRLDGRFRFTKAYGVYSDNTTLRHIRVDTLFDLASLTKVVATLPALLSLVDEGRLGLDDPVIRHAAEFAHPAVTIRQLLQHTSGLPADLPHVPRGCRGRKVLEEIARTPLEAAPGSRVVYSDLGMIVLGEIIARTAGEPLEQAAKRRVFDPLGMSDTGFAPCLPGLARRAAATEYVDGAYIVGEVHDEKCYHMGGVSGSAGLFSTASDLVRYTRLWLHPEKTGIFSPDLFSECFRRPVGGRALGWEVRHGDYLPPACGAAWPIGSFGHTGFTGTSLWIDPQAGLSVVWLTNAVHFGRHTPIRTLRRVLHDRIRAELLPG